MKHYRYVTLDPTGNITCLVLDPVPAEEKPAVTARLMAECEQVGYLEPSVRARAALRMMGGEFCGNAAMAAAAYLAVKDGVQPGNTVRIPLEVSGAERITECAVTVRDNCCEGTVKLPGGCAVRTVGTAAGPMTEARLPGITHLILENAPDMAGAEAEKLLRTLAEDTDAEAVGLLQWNGREGFMRPLVFVRGSDTMVWETGCASGSSAVGALAAVRAGGRTETAVKQPGGTLVISALAENGAVTEITVTGTVRFGDEKTL